MHSFCWGFCDPACVLWGRGLAAAVRGLEVGHLGGTPELVVVPWHWVRGVRGEGSRISHDFARESIYIVYIYILKWWIHTMPYYAATD